MFIPAHPAQAPRLASARNLERLRKVLQDNGLVSARVSVTADHGGSLANLQLLRPDGRAEPIDAEIDVEAVSVAITLEDGTVAVEEREQTLMLLVQAVANDILRTTAPDWAEDFAPPGHLDIRADGTIDLVMKGPRNDGTSLRLEVTPDLFGQSAQIRSAAFVAAEREAGLENLDRMREIVRLNGLNACRLAFDANGGFFHEIDMIMDDGEFTAIDLEGSPETVSYAVQHADGSASVLAKDSMLDHLAEEAAEVVLSATFKDWKANAGRAGTITIPAKGEIEIDFIDAPTATRHFRYLGADLQAGQPAPEEAMPSP